MPTRREVSIESSIPTLTVVAVLRMAMPLDPIQRPFDSGERIGFDAEALQEGGEQQSERFFLGSDFVLPAGIGVDSRACLVVFVPFAEFEIPAVGEAQVFSTGGDNRVIARE